MGKGGYLGRGQGLMDLGEVGRIGGGYMTGQVGWTLRKRGMRKRQEEPQKEETSEADTHAENALETRM